MGKLDDVNQDTPPRSPLVNDDLIDDADLEIIEFDEIDDVSMDDAEEAGGMDGGDDGEEDDDESSQEIDPSLITFSAHKDDVLSCDVHPTKNNIVATGGIDDTVFIWEFANNETNVIKEISFKESVDFVKFSPSGQYLAACDMAGNLVVYETTNWTNCFSNELDESENWASLFWHPTAPVLINVLKTCVTMVNILTQQTKIVTYCTNGYFVKGQVFPDGKRIGVASGTGAVSIVDLKTATVQSTANVKLENNEICSMDIHRDGAVILCGCNLGQIFSVSETGKVSFLPMEQDAGEYVEKIGFAKGEAFKNLAASIHSNGVIRLWDTSKQMLRCQILTEYCVTEMIWHPTEPILFTSHTSGDVLMVDGRTGDIMSKYHCHKNDIFGMALSSDASVFVTCSSDFKARVCRVLNENNGEVATHEAKLDS